ncbi:MAG: Gfo/Idh/MocA family oxidoreductase [Deltaproteobacteria bacterium]|nr:Gfo/Idh/MocA family oxidoreductase [Deltaproteobacteria bacterium]
MIRVALIGCGAAAQQLHFPPLLTNRNVRLDWLVDTRLADVQKLSIRYGIKNVTDDYRQVRDVDAVIVATPHHLHAPIVEFFLQSGCHVLCEKPLDIRSEGATRLVDLARDAKRVLAVGVFRRFYPSSMLGRNAVRTEWLGEIEQVDVEEGGSYLWDLQSLFMVQREKAGGGVLLDTGAHAIDRILWWFEGGEFDEIRYQDNSSTGVESDCELNFMMNWRGRRIPVRVELSRTRTLRNTTRIIMARGTLEIPANRPCEALILNQEFEADGCFAPLRMDLSSGCDPKENDVNTYFHVQLEEFQRAIEENAGCLNAGATTLPFICLVEECYHNRTDLEEPWVTHGLNRFWLGEVSR